MKLYVLVRNDLSKSQQAVQAGHAVAEWVKEWWDAPSPWDNTLVYLRSKDIEKDYSLVSEVQSVFIERFHEPDMNDAMTAFAVIGSYGIPELLENYRLV